MTKAIFLDCDDTILDFVECSHASILDAARELDIALPNGFLDSFDRINPTLWHEVEKGSLTVAELFRIRFQRIFQANGMDYDGVEFEAKFRVYLNSSHIPVSGAEEILEYLSKKYDVFLVSNSILSQQVNRLTLAGFLKYFRELYVSEEIGYSKPRREFFLEALRRSGYAASEVVVIGDSLTSDIEGARNSGISSIWLNPKGKKDERNIHEVMISSLQELKNIL